MKNKKAFVIILIVAVVLIFSIALSAKYIAAFFSKAYVYHISEKYGYDISKYDMITEYYCDDDGTEHIQYQGCWYVTPEDFGFTRGVKTEDMALLSWEVNLNIDQYYSYTENDPIFLIDQHGQVTFKEGFQYKEEYYIVEKTDIKIKLCEMYYADDMCIYELFQYPNLIDCWFTIDEYEEVTFTPEIFLIDGEYYIHFGSMPQSYKLSDTFRDALLAEGLLK